MSLLLEPLNPIPSLTAQVCKQAFPKGNLYIQMRDELGCLFCDQDFAALFPTRGQHAFAPWRLALITIMQFIENLTDRQAAEMVRGRLDWKYALSLELTDCGFDFSILSEFRTRLVDGEAEKQLFDLVLERFKQLGLLKAGGKQRTDSTHVLAAVRALNRTEGVAETLRAALNALAVVAPTWLRQQVTPEWFERYSHRIEEYRIPKSEEARKAYLELVGADGIQLLQSIYAQTTPFAEMLRSIEAVEILRRVWVQHFYFNEGQLYWREAKDLPKAALRYDSPYDTEARYSEKRATKWLGYKVHLTEVCDEQHVHLITNVETTPATIPDVSMTETIQSTLVEKALGPEQHLVDMGYTEVGLLLTSQQEYAMELVGPVKPDCGWQSSADNGFGAAHFKVDWDKQQLTCPKGKLNKSWLPTQDGDGFEVIHVKFSRTDCSQCESRLMCTRSAGQRREVTLRPKEQYEALQGLRQKQQDEPFKVEYALRAGVEGTLSEGVRTLGLRRSRYIGLAKTHLQHLAIASAINLIRAVEWLGESSSNRSLTKGATARTPLSRFAQLALVA